MCSPAAIANNCRRKLIDDDDVPGIERASSSIQYTWYLDVAEFIRYYLDNTDNILFRHPNHILNNHYRHRVH